MNPFGVACLMFLAGLFLSAFFSGSETGFYRATRVRLAMDVRSGDWVSRGLLWLINRPSVFVATTLVGNNLANYLVSLAIVLGTHRLMGDQNLAAEVMAPLVLAPLVFVYGELLPKNLFFAAPNRLLRCGGPWFLACCVLFAPIAAVLWLLSEILHWVLGQSPELVRAQVARSELESLLEEGHHVGILRPTQQQLARRLMMHANDPVAKYADPCSRVTTIQPSATADQALRLAHARRAPLLVVNDPDTGQPQGYVRVVDIYLQGKQWPRAVRPLPEVPQTKSPIAVAMEMQRRGDLLARVVDDEGHTVGILDVRRITESLALGTTG